MKLKAKPELKKMVVRTGLSELDFAKKSSVAHLTVCKMLKGNNVTIKTAAKVSECLEEDILACFEIVEK